MNLEIIEKYIDNELVGKELTDFKKLLSTDSSLQRDYNLSLEINNSLVEDDVMNLRETLDYMYNEPKVKRLPNRFAKRKIYYAAASVALMVATGGLVQKYSGSDMTNFQLFEKYYQPYEVTVTYRSGNEEVDRLFINALEKYEGKEFDKALVLFETVLEKRSDDMAVNLYSGITYMEEEKYQKASNSFTDIIEDDNNLFVEQAKWYLALCYVVTEDNMNAEKLLNEIINEDSYFKSQAKKVLKELHN